MKFLPYCQSKWPFKFPQVYSKTNAKSFNDFWYQLYKHLKLSSLHMLITQNKNNVNKYLTNLRFIYKYSKIKNYIFAKISLIRYLLMSKLPNFLILLFIELKIIPQFLKTRNTYFLQFFLETHYFLRRFKILCFKLW